MIHLPNGDTSLIYDQLRVFLAQNLMDGLI
jgi:hypothetical protein